MTESVGRLIYVGLIAKYVVQVLKTKKKTSPWWVPQEPRWETVTGARITVRALRDGRASVAPRCTSARFPAHPRIRCPPIRTTHRTSPPLLERRVGPVWRSATWRYLISCSFVQSRKSFLCRCPFNILAPPNVGDNDSVVRLLVFGQEYQAVVEMHQGIDTCRYWEFSGSKSGPACGSASSWCLKANSISHK